MLFNLYRYRIACTGAVVWTWNSYIPVYSSVTVQTRTAEHSV